MEGVVGRRAPYHAPVFVLTHHEREPLEMKGGTTFHFVTEGTVSALDRARAAAGVGDGSRIFDGVPPLEERGEEVQLFLEEEDARGDEPRLDEVPVAASA